MANQYTSSGIRKINGKRRTEYAIWTSMKQRCCNPKDRAYSFYGGRGIRVCERWMNSFEAFLEDVGPRPSLRHSLDRYPDNNGDYGPGNFRWATDKEQANNTSANSLYTFNGVTKTMTQWADEYGVSIQLLCSRLVKAKWDIEKALTTPSQKKWGNLPVNEILAKYRSGIPILQIAGIYGCNWSTIKRLINKQQIK